MSFCSMRAHSYNDASKTVGFTVADIPLVINNDSFVLLNRQFSPILRLDTVVLGSDVGVYQNDVLSCEGELWYVIFDEGFVASTYDKTHRKYLYEFNTLNVVREMTKEEREHFGVKPRRMRFKCDSKVFTLEDIIGKYQSKIIVSPISYAFPADDVYQDTHVHIRLGRSYFGELYKGRKLIMCYGRVCVQNEFGVYDIVEGKYITRKRGT